MHGAVVWYACGLMGRDIMAVVVALVMPTGIGERWICCDLAAYRFIVPDIHARSMVCFLFLRVCVCVCASLACRWGIFCPGTRPENRRSRAAIAVCQTVETK